MLLMKFPETCSFGWVWESENQNNMKFELDWDSIQSALPLLRIMQSALLGHSMTKPQKGNRSPWESKKECFFLSADQCHFHLEGGKMRIFHCFFAMDEMFVPLPKCICWRPTPQGNAVWRQGLWKVLRFRWGHEGGPPSRMGLVPL